MRCLVGLLVIALALAPVVPAAGPAEESPETDRVVALDAEELAARLLPGATPDPTTPPRLGVLVRHRFVSAEAPWFLDLDIGLFEDEEEARRSYGRTMPSVSRSSKAAHLRHRNLVVVARRCEREAGETTNCRGAKPTIEEIQAWQDRLAGWIRDPELVTWGSEVDLPAVELVALYRHPRAKLKERAGFGLDVPPDSPPLLVEGQPRPRSGPAGRLDPGFRVVDSSGVLRVAKPSGEVAVFRATEARHRGVPVRPALGEVSLAPDNRLGISDRIAWSGISLEDGRVLTAAPEQDTGWSPILPFDPRTGLSPADRRWLVDLLVLTAEATASGMFPDRRSPVVHHHLNATTGREVLRLDLANREHPPTKQQPRRVLKIQIFVTGNRATAEAIFRQKQGWWLKSPAFAERHKEDDPWRRVVGDDVIEIGDRRFHSATAYMYAAGLPEGHENLAPDRIGIQRGNVLVEVQGLTFFNLRKNQKNISWGLDGKGYRLALEILERLDAALQLTRRGVGVAQGR